MSLKGRVRHLVVPVPVYPLPLLAPPLLCTVERSLIHKRAHTPYRTDLVSSASSYKQTGSLESGGALREGGKLMSHATDDDE